MAHALPECLALCLEGCADSASASQECKQGMQDGDQDHTMETASVCGTAEKALACVWCVLLARKTLILRC
jgi:hypothetical protein